MEKEIGSIFEIDKNSLKPDCEIVKGQMAPFFANGYTQYCMVSSGRDALSMAIRQIRREHGCERLRCLLPMYTCDTVIAPFEQYGAEWTFYPADTKMQPDPVLFQKRLEADRPAVVVVHAHYGVDTLACVRPFLKAFQSQGGIVIEDITQNIFMPLDYQADYYVLSLRKWLGIPDGGMILSKCRLAATPAAERTDFTEQKWQALTDKYCYLKQAESGTPGMFAEKKQAFLFQHREAERLLEQDTGVYRMSQRSWQIIRQTDFEWIRQSRAENAACLSDILSGCPGVVCPLSYDENAAPLYFPVYVQNQAQVQQYLCERDIYAPVLWPVPSQIGGMPECTQYIYHHMLALPCDQRYGSAEMARVADCLRRAAAL